MTENVYGGTSLDPTTWVKKRDESQDFGSLGLPELVAMNHFPSSPIADRELLRDFITYFNMNNSKDSFRKHIDAFPKVPNYVNVDFIDVGDCGWAALYCNTKLHNTAVPS
jgi:hypothetical protein